jgi:hypothetical protein
MKQKSKPARGQSGGFAEPIAPAGEATHITALTFTAAEFPEDEAILI